MVENKSVPGEAVNCRCRSVLSTVQPEIVDRVVLGDEEQKIRSFGRGGHTGGTACCDCRQQKQQECF